MLRICGVAFRSASRWTAPPAVDWQVTDYLGARQPHKSICTRQGCDVLKNKARVSRTSTYLMIVTDSAPASCIRRDEVRTQVQCIAGSENAGPMHPGYRGDRVGFRFRKRVGMIINESASMLDASARTDSLIALCDTSRLAIIRGSNAEHLRSFSNSETGVLDEP
jgi:hypothetical protein